MILPLLFLVIRPIAARSCSGDITISSQSDANSYAQCEKIRGTVTIDPSATGTITFENLEALIGDLVIEGTESLNGVLIPDLEVVKGSVRISDNAQLNQLAFENLSAVRGDVTVQDNPSLLDLVLGDLESVGGGLFLDGEFNRLSFENLEHVAGKSDIVNTGSASCSAIEALSSVFRNSYTCETTSPTPSATETPSSTSTSTSTSSPTETPSPEDDSGLSGGAIAGIVVGVVVGVLIILALIWTLVRRRNRRLAATSPSAFDGTCTGTTAGAAAAVLAPGLNGDPEKLSPQTQHTAVSPVPTEGSPIGPTSSPSSLPYPDAGTGIPMLAAVAGATSIPRRPVSVSHPSSIPSSLTPGLMAIPPTNRSHPHHTPSEADVPMLDSGNVHEAPAEPVAGAQHAGANVRAPYDGQFYELDAGPVGSFHQMAINRED